MGQFWELVKLINRITMGSAAMFFHWILGAVIGASLMFAYWLANVQKLNGGPVIFTALNGGPLAKSLYLAVPFSWVNALSLWIWLCIMMALTFYTVSIVWVCYRYDNCNWVFINAPYAYYTSAIRWFARTLARDRDIRTIADANADLDEELAAIKNPATDKYPIVTEE